MLVIKYNFLSCLATKIEGCTVQTLMHDYCLTRTPHV